MRPLLLYIAVLGCPLPAAADTEDVKLEAALSDAVDEMAVPEKQP